jgi:CDP-diglyceride synthetase
MRKKKPGLVIILISLIIAVWATYSILEMVRREVQIATSHALDTVQAFVSNATGLTLNYDYLYIDTITTFSAHGIALE